jgi:hypothetical protein
MDAEQSIAEIKWLERIFAVPDTRPLSAGDLAAANRRHDEQQASSPWSAMAAMSVLYRLVIFSPSRFTGSVRLPVS